MRLVEQHGEEVNEAYENTPPLMFHSLNAEALLDYLEDFDFLCVVVDGRMRLRQDLVEELRERIADGEG